MADLWRFIDTGPCTAAYNMSLDEAISLSVRQEVSPPTLRLYGWDIPSVSIGYFQKSTDYNIGYCMQNNIPVVRRMTGGRAIFHSDEITYSFSVRTKGHFAGGLLDSYRKISAAFNLAFLKVGMTAELKLGSKSRNSSRSHHRLKSPLCFQSTSYGELTIHSKKVIGSAQKRWTNGLLQQGSIPLSVDKNAIIEIFRPKDTQKIEETMVGLKEIAPVFNTGKFKDAVRVSFEETFNAQLHSSSPSHEEISLARELETQKYLSNQWNFKR